MSRPDIFNPRLRGNVLAPEGSDIVLAEWTADGAVGGERLYQAPLHQHQEAEAWYVLEGTLGVRAGVDEYEVPAGGAIVVPGDIEHTFWNPRPEPARYLLVMGARTHALVEAIHSTGDRSQQAMQDLFESYGAKLFQ